VIWKNVLGGKWFFFANYEGFRFPNSETRYQGSSVRRNEARIAAVRRTVYNLNPVSTLYPSTAAAVGALVPGTTYAGSGRRLTRED